MSKLDESRFPLGPDACQQRIGPHWIGYRQRQPTDGNPLRRPARRTAAPLIAEKEQAAAFNRNYSAIVSDAGRSLQDVANLSACTRLSLQRIGSWLGDCQMPCPTEASS